MASGSVNQERLWSRLMRLAEIGRQASGGVTRMSFTREERMAKDLVAGWMQGTGLSVREDAVGNLIGRLDGTDAHAPVVLVGSHLDSVPNGGKFDGPLGVLGALEAVQTLRAQGISHIHPIEVIAFTDEEGARFRFGMIGSRALAGTLTAEHLQAQDADGVTVAEAMRSAGLSPETVHKAARAAGSVKAYVELHIEQGRVLEAANLPVGIVTGIAGPLWLRFRILGEAGHAGTTPMRMRKDALAAAAQVLTAAETAAAGQKRTVATVGQLTVSPGGVNIIPGCAEFTLDLRDTDESVRDEVERQIRHQAEAICARRGVRLEIQELQRVPPVSCSAWLQEEMAGCAQEMGIQTLSLPSGAGHDGMQLAGLCPVGMLFVRSKDGISHQPEEWSSPEDCAIGVELLYRTLVRVAN
ncbi:Zn-dependent hydrolase [Alicyclobacillus shizuokensis]|uniref:Zn-dependent hydrolase n=1 Tax=Alicyclobacillus shizuokensis TaxID=392014 RepID=UPI000A708FB9|nr:Zn-dependent hydrolase [Alicyclobacillus shizuokensis]